MGRQACQANPVGGCGREPIRSVRHAGELARRARALLHRNLFGASRSFRRDAARSPRLFAQGGSTGGRGVDATRRDVRALRVRSIFTPPRPERPALEPFPTSLSWPERASRCAMVAFDLGSLPSESTFSHRDQPDGDGCAAWRFYDGRRPGLGDDRPAGALRHHGADGGRRHKFSREDWETGSRHLPTQWEDGSDDRAGKARAMRMRS